MEYGIKNQEIRIEPEEGIKIKTFERVKLQMSRDLTPLETGFVSLQADPTFDSLHDVWTVGRHSYPVYTDAQKETLLKYPSLGRCAPKVVLSLSEFLTQDTGLSLLEEMEEQVRSHFEYRQPIQDGLLFRWLSGQLVEHYYYREENDRLFIQEIRKRIA